MEKEISKIRNNFTTYSTKANDKINYLRKNKMLYLIIKQLIASLLFQVLKNLNRVVRLPFTMSFDIKTKYLTSRDIGKANPYGYRLYRL